MKIGIDIDEVLADFVNGINKYYNHLFDANLHFEDYREYDLEKTWGCDKEKAVEIVNDFYKSENFGLLIPIKGSQEGIGVLAANHHLIAITSRPQFTQAKTTQWIEKYFGILISEIVFNGQYKISASAMSKTEVCLKKGIEIIIEDHFGIAKKCSENGIIAFLLDKPWNRNIQENPKLIKVKSWKNITEKLK